MDLICYTCSHEWTYNGEFNEDAPPDCPNCNKGEVCEKEWACENCDNVTNERGSYIEHDFQTFCPDCIEEARAHTKNRDLLSETQAKYEETLSQEDYEAFVKAAYNYFGEEKAKEIFEKPTLIETETTPNHHKHNMTCAKNRKKRNKKRRNK